MRHILAYEGKTAVSLGIMQEEYATLFVPWMNKRSNTEGTLMRPPCSHATGVEWVRGFDKTHGQSEVFAILLHESVGTDEEYGYIGHTGVHDITWPHGFASVGSIIGDPKWQGRGYGTEALLLILYHAFMVLGLRKVTSTVSAFNARSIGHLLKCGYQPVGCYRDHYFHDGRYANEIIFEVFRSEWEDLWSRYNGSRILPKLSDEHRTLVRKLVNN